MKTTNEKSAHRTDASVDDVQNVHFQDAWRAVRASKEHSKKLEEDRERASIELPALREDLPHGLDGNLVHLLIGLAGDLGHGDVAISALHALAADLDMLWHALGSEDVTVGREFLQEYVSVLAQRAKNAGAWPSGSSRRTARCTNDPPEHERRAAARREVNPKPRTFLSEASVSAVMAGDSDTKPQLGELLMKVLCPTRSNPADMMVGALHLVADELETLQWTLLHDCFNPHAAEDILTSASAKLRALTELHIAVMNEVDARSAAATGESLEDPGPGIPRRTLMDRARSSACREDSWVSVPGWFKPPYGRRGRGGLSLLLLAARC